MTPSVKAQGVQMCRPPQELVHGGRALWRMGRLVSSVTSTFSGGLSGHKPVSSLETGERHWSGHCPPAHRELGA